MQIWKSPCRSGNRNADLEIAVQIWKSRCKSGKRHADLEIAMQIWKSPVQIWKSPCRSGNRDADLENAVQIWKTRCRSGNRDANLEIAMQIWKSPCRFARAILTNFVRQKNKATRGPGEYRGSRFEVDPGDPHQDGPPSVRLESSARRVRHRCERIPLEAHD
jgi:hypothetical protein